MAFTQSMDLPMLAYSARLSKVANIAFGIVLFMAVYSAPTSTYYGFSTKLKESPKKKIHSDYRGIYRVCLRLDRL